MGCEFLRSCRRANPQYISYNLDCYATRVTEMKDIRIPKPFPGLSIPIDSMAI